MLNGGEGGGWREGEGLIAKWMGGGSYKRVGRLGVYGLGEIRLMASSPLL